MSFTYTREPQGKARTVKSGTNQLLLKVLKKQSVPHNMRKGVKPMHNPSPSKCLKYLREVIISVEIRYFRYTYLDMELAVIASPFAEPKR